MKAMQKDLIIERQKLKEEKEELAHQKQRQEKFNEDLRNELN